MKFGPRKPSLKKSISARTTGKIKRKIKKTVIPGYGKKGMGYIKDPEKAVYNKIYNKTTVGIDDIISSNQNNTDNAPNSTSNTVNNEYSNNNSQSTPDLKQNNIFANYADQQLITRIILFFVLGIILLLIGISTWNNDKLLASMAILILICLIIFASGYLNELNNRYSNKQSIAKPNDAHTTPIQSTPQSVPTQQTPPQNTRKPITDKQLIGFCAVCGILFLALIVYLFTADETEDKQTDTPQQTQAALVQPTSAPRITTPVPAELLIEPKEHGTKEYAMYITYKAENDSINVSVEQLQEAVDFIKYNTNSYLSTQENIEKTMYYGRLLQVKFWDTDSIYNDAGRKAYNMTKFIYFGTSDVNSENTLARLKELQEIAVKLPDLK